jgi:hypothetical protein
MLKDTTKSVKRTVARKGSITPKAPLRVGVVFGHDIVKMNIPALTYLIVQLNKLQHTFEFEILPTFDNAELLLLLNQPHPVSRKEAINLAGDFLSIYGQEIGRLNNQDNYGLEESPCAHLMVITLARFDDNYYSSTGEHVGIIALGNWEKRMAPPSLLEIIITLLLSESVLFLDRPHYRKLYHLGTKGCVFDFNPSINDIKARALQGFVCNHCRDLLKQGGQPNFADELTEILSKKWLGNLSDPSSPATIITKLGYNMFITKGLKPSFWENLQGTLQQDIPRQIINIIGAIVLAALLIYLGLKK